MLSRGKWGKKLKVPILVLLPKETNCCTVGPHWNRKRVTEREDEAKSAGWHCVDYGDVIIHIMTPDQREYYDLDALYSKGEPVAVDGLTGIVDELVL